MTTSPAPTLIPTPPADPTTLAMLDFFRTPVPLRPGCPEGVRQTKLDEWLAQLDRYLLPRETK